MRERKRERERERPRAKFLLKRCSRKCAEEQSEKTEIRALSERERRERERASEWVSASHHPINQDFFRSPVTAPGLKLFSAGIFSKAKIKFQERRSLPHFDLTDALFRLWHARVPSFPTKKKRFRLKISVRPSSLNGPIRFLAEF